MKKFMLLLFLCMDIAIVSAQYSTVLYNIPAAGQTVTVPSQYLNNSFIALQTDGAVNLASNTYTLTYSALPPNGYTWRVKMDFRRLTQAASGANVTIFGVKPLQAHPTVDTFDITYSVIPDSVGTKYLYYVYNGLTDAGRFNAPTTFNGVTTFNDRADFNDTARFFSWTYLKPTSGITTGQTVTSLDTTGKLGYGCVPWCVLGNSGLNTTTNFLGTTDTAALRFRVNNITSGIIDYTLGNTAWGYQTLKSNTTGNGNVAIGGYALYVNTTGFSNTGVGGVTLTANTTGQYNTAVGNSALLANTTGSYNTGCGISALLGTTTGTYNTAVGQLSLQTLTTGSYNTGIGTQTNVAATSTHDAIAIGYQAVAGNYGVAIGSTTAAANQMRIAGVRTISLPNSTTAIRYVLTDTSGSGDFIPQPIPLSAQTKITPVTGDSSVITTSSNLIKPAGTIANYTIILPASPYSGQLLEFSFTQIITTLRWSVALNQAVTAHSTLPSAATAGGTAKIMYNSADATWYNW